MAGANDTKTVKRKRYTIQRHETGERLADDWSSDGMDPNGSQERPVRGTLDFWASPSKQQRNSSTINEASSRISVGKGNINSKGNLKRKSSTSSSTCSDSSSLPRRNIKDHGPIGKESSFVGRPLSKLTSIANQFSRNAQSLPRRTELRRPKTDMMWADAHTPYTENELAVHKKKLQQVREWLIDAGLSTSKQRDYSKRLLVLAGPAGCGKSATLCVLSIELGFEIVEWRNPINDNAFGSGGGTLPVMQRFVQFIAQAYKYPSLQFGTTTEGQVQSDNSRKVILVEDLPNIHSSMSNRNSFLTAMNNVIAASHLAHPVVLIISECYAKNDIEAGHYSKRREDSQDIRSVLSQDILQSKFFTVIHFNPIAVTFMRKALRQVVHDEFLSYPSQIKPSQELVDTVAESSDGDIRSALNTLQFFSLMETNDIDLPTKSKAATNKVKKRAKQQLSADTQKLISTISSRESSLVLFHGLGKILYNKRHGDDHPKAGHPDDGWLLPDHMKQYARRPSEVDIDELIETMPVDQSLFSLYLHQNLPQFCDTVDPDYLRASAYLSDADIFESTRRYDDMATVVTGARYAALVSVRGILMSLPSPVTRRGQKMFKPEYWDIQKQSLINTGALEDVNAWIQYNWGVQSGSSSFSNVTSLAVDAVSYYHRIIQAREMHQSQNVPSRHVYILAKLSSYTPPREYRSTARFLGEKDDGEEEEESPQVTVLKESTQKQEEELPPVPALMYLSDDDIED